MKLAMFPIPLKTLQLCRERNFLTSPTEFRAGGTACPLPVRYRYWKSHKTSEIGSKPVGAILKENRTLGPAVGS